MAFTPLPNLSLGNDITPANWTLWIDGNFNVAPSSLSSQKGDLFPASGNQSAIALPVGTDGQVVESDSSQSGGMKNSWAFIPVGGIIMWSGSLPSLPSNWQICDGTNGTPNLRDRFIVGAGSGYSVGSSGGSASINLQHNHTLSTGQSTTASHTHTQGVTGAGSSHRHSGTTSVTAATMNQLLTGGTPLGAYTHSHTFYTAYESVHTHTNVSTGSDGEHLHSSGTDNQLSTVQDIRPPYYALAFIMRMS